MSNDAKSFILYLKEYPDTAAKTKDLAAEAVAEFAHKIGFDFSAEEWQKAYAAKESFADEKRTLPKSCGCGW